MIKIGTQGKEKRIRKEKKSKEYNFISPSQEKREKKTKV
jgi:hypothetical protein